MFTARFELRVPPFADTTHAQLHREYRDMVSWCDDNGIATVIVSEHHGAEDGFMPSPLVLAAAALARTDNITVAVSALLLPLHDPIRVAEDIATIDLMAPGRLSVTMGVGYREFEFDMFAKDRTRRGRDTEEAIELILRCWSGEPFEYQGRTIRVTPKPVTEPHPVLMVGGSVPASARRAARLGLPFSPSTPDQSLADLYYAEAARLGYETPFAIVPDGPSMVMVTEDPERTWAAIERHALYDAALYASWQYDDHHNLTAVDAHDVAGLAASGQWEVLTPEGCAQLVRDKGSAMLHPLAGGIDPAIGWESLELVKHQVMPLLADDPGG
ncbi:LLM class flavin-dependent oxidoreductase [Candidatus Poriferisocius sp.]|uniref:LLM class flavin-dependent oxidoreductase n=1 Tax=Candidatus Poriferisocius sp. TaxID=3101276 RepID=UPI003B59FE05